MQLDESLHVQCGQAPPEDSQRPTSQRLASLLSSGGSAAQRLPEEGLKLSGLGPEEGFGSGPIQPSGGGSAAQQPKDEGSKPSDEDLKLSGPSQQPSGQPSSSSSAAAAKEGAKLSGSSQQPGQQPASLPSSGASAPQPMPDAPPGNSSGGATQLTSQVATGPGSQARSDLGSGSGSRGARGPGSGDTDAAAGAKQSQHRSVLSNGNSGQGRQLQLLLSSQPAQRLTPPPPPLQLQPPLQSQSFRTPQLGQRPPSLGQRPPSLLTQTQNAAAAALPTAASAAPKHRHVSGQPRAQVPAGSARQQQSAGSSAGAARPAAELYDGTAATAKAPAAHVDGCGPDKGIRDPPVGSCAAADAAAATARSIGNGGGLAAWLGAGDIGAIANDDEELARLLGTSFAAHGGGKQEGRKRPPPRDGFDVVCDFFRIDRPAQRPRLSS